MYIVLCHWFIYLRNNSWKPYFVEIITFSNGKGKLFQSVGSYCHLRQTIFVLFVSTMYVCVYLTLYRMSQWIEIIRIKHRSNQFNECSLSRPRYLLNHFRFQSFLLYNKCNYCNEYSCFVFIC